MHRVNCPLVRGLAALTVAALAGCGGISTRRVDGSAGGAGNEAATGGAGTGPGATAGVSGTTSAGGAGGTGGTLASGAAGGTPATGGAGALGSGGTSTGTGGALAGTGGAGPLPDAGGPCTSQADCGGESYADIIFCLPKTCASPEGECTLFPGGCPLLFDPVCGCDGTSYPNECYALFQGVGSAYAGGCRDGSITSCVASGTCGDGGVCIEDPRVPCEGDRCSGICLPGDNEVCGTSVTGMVLACDGACVLPIDGCSTTDDGICGRCVYSEQTPCDDAPCPDPELCVQVFSCLEPPCPSVCVRP